jgi:hypothetical protein
VSDWTGWICTTQSFCTEAVKVMRGNESALNFADNPWRLSAVTTNQDVVNPAAGDVLGRVPLSLAAEVAKPSATMECAMESDIAS